MPTLIATRTANEPRPSSGPLYGRPVPVRGRPGRLLGVAAGYLLVLGLTAVAFVWTSGGQWADDQLTSRAAGTFAAARTLLSLAGNPVVLALLLLLVLVVGAARGRTWAGVAGVGALLCSVVGADALKLAMPRPDFEFPGYSHNSFPSGHVAGATGLMFALMLVSPARARWWLAFVGTAGVPVIASATMAAGWHRLSDALGAVALASALCCLAAAVLVRWRPAAPGRSYPPVPVRWRGGLPVRRRGLAGARDRGARDRGARDQSPGRSWPAAALLTVVGPLLVGAVAVVLPIGPGQFFATVLVGEFTALSMGVVAGVLCAARV
ncbi:hypothetical protein GCM10023322_68150 [Rugosimonospora acidiphila]|uniref:Phosphatidic acid phosphatase type 2/haloperoxidase domain-containing protein n=2 Tax=Rugosimonospora acidiphila TaxID=556531 RepID=A0ABP9SL64_9ACTN